LPERAGSQGHARRRGAHRQGRAIHRGGGCERSEVHRGCADRPRRDCGARPLALDLQMSTRDSLLQSVDDESRALARRLVRTARFGTLAVLEPGSGHPYASRAAVATDIDGVPVMLLSALSPHTAALDVDPRCTLLLGEPG